MPITLIFNKLPPSINATYKAKCVCGHGAMYKSDEAKDWQLGAQWVAKEIMEDSPLLDCDLQMEVEMVCKRDRDIDGSLKLLLDALQGICYHNDSQVKKLTIAKTKGKEELLKVKINEKETTP